MRRTVSFLLAATLMAAIAGFWTASLTAQEPRPFASACDGDNPYFATSCYAQGILPEEAAVVAFRNTPDNSDHHVLATQADVGSTYGIAYRHSEDALYVGAYHKRGTAFGPGGPGMIYRVDVATGDVTQWLAVPNAGTDRHDSSGNYWPDTPARDIAGVTSLADVEISEDGSTLFVMNLFDRKIYRYRIDDKAFLGTIDIGSVNESWHSQARPFGLGFWRGKLYHGVVHSAFTSQDRDELQAFVYETDPDGSNVRLVNQFSLDFPRGNVVLNIPARWNPWRNGYNAIGPGQLGAYPQPMLADIEFADNGDMLLGFRDRNGDMTFFNPGGRNPPNEGTGIPAGDILISRYNGDTWDTTPVPEFFNEDFGPRNNPSHQETGFGGLARVRDADIVVTVGLAPLRISSGGAYWFDNVTGRNTAREELYNFESEVNFGKANGLGDVELLCGPAQPTPTPTATETATDEPTVTATTTPTATTTTTPTVTDTPTPTTTTTATTTSTTTATSTGTVTVVTPSTRQETAPPPEATSELPRLPQTGGGGMSGRSSIMLLALPALLAMAFLMRRRRGAGKELAA